MIAPVFDSLVAAWGDRFTEEELRLIYSAYSMSLAGAVFNLDDERLDRWVNRALAYPGSDHWDGFEPSAWTEAQHLRKGDMESAAAALDSAVAANVPASANPSGTLYVMARVAQRLGRDREALGLLESLRQSTRYPFDYNGFDAIWGLISLSYLYSGQSHERLGERALAREAYEAFIGYWSDAEPSVRHHLQTAREGLARVGG